MYRKGQHTVTSTSRVNSISHPNVKLPCIKPINLVKPQYRRLKQASIIKATSSQIIEASFFTWVKYPGIITKITTMIMIMMIMMIIIIISHYYYYYYYYYYFYYYLAQSKLKLIFSFFQRTAFLRRKAFVRRKSRSSAVPLWRIRL